MSEGHIDPTEEQLAGLTAAAGEDEAPVFMLNLLRFKERADGVDDGISGAEAYGRYAAETQRHLDRVGAQIIWAGAAGDTVIGPPGEWHAAAVVRYPSRSKFLEMVSDPEYLETSKHRSAALADSRLIPCTDAGLA